MMKNDEIIIRVLVEKIEELESRNRVLDQWLHEFVMTFSPENGIEERIYNEACKLTGEKPFKE